MTATGEVENPAVEQAAAAAAAEVPAAEQPQAAEEKKPKAKKEKKPRAPKTASHPPYFQMIKDALLSLNEKSGSSPYAIAKYMEEKLKAVLPANFRKILGLQLKNSVARGKLIKIRASYKLSEAGKEVEEKVTTKKTAEKKPKSTGATDVGARKGRGGRKRNAETEKKVVVPRRTRKAAAAAKPKQPKSIKSPAAKKARKAKA